MIKSEESSESAESVLSASTSTTRKDDTSREEYEIAKKESKQVLMQRGLVIAVLFLAALGICLVVFFISRNAEKDEFEAHFEGGAEKIVSSFEDIVQKKLGAVGSLCLALTARGKDTSTVVTDTNANASGSKEHSWPFVTMDSFQERAASARILSNVLHMSLVPIVTEENREAWESYSVRNGEWYAEGFAYQLALQENGFSLQGASRRSLEEFKTQITPFMERNPRMLQSNATKETNEDAEDPAEVEFDLFIPKIYEYTPYWEIVFPPPESAPFAPVWQSAPVTFLDGINLNLRSFEDVEKGLSEVMSTGVMSLSGFMTAEPGNTSSPDLYTAWYSELLSTAAGKPVSYSGDPISEIAYPIFSDFTGEREVVAVMNAQFSWQTYFEGLLPDNARGFVMVLENACDGAYTYKINGKEVEMVGSGDLHKNFKGKNVSTYLQDSLAIHDGSREGVKLSQRGCPYSLHVYPSQEMHDEYITRMPIIITVCILFIFVFTACMFVIYDRLVERRQRIVVTTAKQSTDIVSSLFPEAIRDRLLHQDESDFLSPNQRVKSYLSGGAVDTKKVKPIADLFPHTTVMFADISGFTAWSSTRDPSQVFALLEQLYGDFDEIARKRKVFKVETIGDSYVCVTGLPNPQATHVVIMARFAGECRQKLSTILKELELTLGPDTTDLGMRFGLHSGPVTAGVLRGERARFQLFGDTVNTAARMESTGKRNMIQVSQTTANLLVSAGKEHWLESRDDAVLAKGKGVLNTFWIFPERQEKSNSQLAQKQNQKVSFRVADKPVMQDTKAMKQARLIQWMTDLLLLRLKQIVVRRKTLQGDIIKDSSTVTPHSPKNGSMPLDEVVEVIKLPDFDDKAVSQEDPASVEIPGIVVKQLRDHVAAVASKYRDNPFHCFEHACHVTMSVSKLLGRVVSPEIDLDALKGKDAHGAVASHLHDYTHGINSDPLTLFGIVYSALIHDVDHRGVSNTQLMKEDETMAATYKGKSVAEQNSLDTSWDMLMSNDLKELHAYLFGNDQSEVLRLRQVVVNIVLATDIFDEELNDLRKKRWCKAFDESAGGIDNHRRATIVIEHIIQASDVSHTMQHWHIYRKWNRQLFQEMYAAYKAGRMGADPASFWYKGELGFFDNYIIPLAKKLKDCGVFGVSSDEYLNYALMNRAEWEVRGQMIVQELIQELEDTERDTADDDSLSGDDPAEFSVRTGVDPQIVVEV